MHTILITLEKVVDVCNYFRLLLLLTPFGMALWNGYGFNNARGIAVTLAVNSKVFEHHVFLISCFIGHINYTLLDKIIAPGGG
uniref:Uncharacterized protein n=1 Tax=Panstrongylus lignarius TaxID=156445 RepID=A0A224XSG6_9HEMI